MAKSSVNTKAFALKAAGMLSHNPKALSWFLSPI
jgi:hypothetical protein